MTDPITLTPADLALLSRHAHLGGQLCTDPAKRKRAKALASVMARYAETGGVMLLPVTAEEPQAPWLDGGADKPTGAQRQMRRWTEIMEHFGPKEGTADGSPR